jgi:hypothetical protein
MVKQSNKPTNKHPKIIWNEAVFYKNNPDKRQSL